ncbi:MAG: hypothetical protein KAV99_06610 [Candidatus Latescibacteria bacterium]|nr:hypothetical protein [Candidatus Latescibacterota bacterium]
MEQIEYFDYQKVAKEMKVPDTTLKKIERKIGVICRIKTTGKLLFITVYAL